MAKKSSVNKNNRRKKLVKKYAAKLARLKAEASDPSKSPEERFLKRLEIEKKVPRNANPTRVRNRCELTGRARGNYRKFGISRLKLRELASKGLIPGVTKSSW